MNIKEEIVDYLIKKSGMGANIVKISENLGRDRKTISNYLMELKEEGTISSRKIGRIKIWYHLGTERIDKSQKYFYQMYTLMLKYIDHIESTKSPEDFKKLGKLMARDLDFEEVANINLKDFFTIPNNPFDILSISKQVMDGIDLYYGPSDDYEWVLPIPHYNDDMNNLYFILRMRDSAYIDLPMHFYIMAGGIEAIIETIFINNINFYSMIDNFKVYIHRIYKKENAVDIKISAKLKKMKKV